MRSVSWPTQGDRSTFRRRAAVFTTGGLVLIAAGLVAATALNPALLRPLVPLGIAAALLLALFTHAAARTAARRAEVANSFANLRVLHHGASYEVAARPLLGEYTSRRHAAKAAMDRGGWALVIQAWDRYYLLACRPDASQANGRAPVSFRSRAVADVVPALRDDVALGA
jgi:hypothetical protein